MTETRSAGATRPDLRRPLAFGAAVGFVLAFVGAALALTFPLFEELEWLLVPAATLLSPLSEEVSDWNGLLAMLLVGVVNAAVFAVVFALVAAGAAAVRRRR